MQQNMLQKTPPNFFLNLTNKHNYFIYNIM